MDKKILSSAVLTEIGVSQWEVRDPALILSGNRPLQDEVPTLLKAEEKPSRPSLQASTDLGQLSSSPAKRAGSAGRTIVVLGSGLDAVWENDEHPAWQLWQNIVFAFEWSECSVAFYDLDHLVTDEMVFSVIEEVIDCGVDWVLSMDSDHLVSQQLADGVQVIDIPDFDTMLSDSYSKQAFYESVVKLH